MNNHCESCHRPLTDGYAEITTIEGERKRLCLSRCALIEHVKLRVKRECRAMEVEHA